MADEEIRAVWQGQPSNTLNTDDIRRRVEVMERKTRRDRIDFAVAFVLITIVLVGIAILFPHPLLTAGAALTLFGLGILAGEVIQHRRSAPAPESAASSLDYQRALLQHRIEFCRKGLWLRIAALAPGGVMFFAGFAAARPDLAPFLYFQLATFVFALLLVVPVNRKAAARLEREIRDLEQLR